MGKVVLNAAPKAVSSRIATLESANYVFVGFHKHEMRIKDKDAPDGIKKVPTFAPVLVKLDVNGNPIGLYQVNRSDLTRLENPRIEWNNPTHTYNNTGTFVEEMSQTVNVDGFFNEALWMNVALPKFRNTVLQLKVTQFAGISSTGSIWRGAKVYEINKTSQTFSNHGALNALITAKGWKTEDCVGFADFSAQEFEYEGKTVQLTPDYRLIATA